MNFASKVNRSCFKDVLALHWYKSVYCIQCTNKCEPSPFPFYLNTECLVLYVFVDHTVSPLYILMHALDRGAHMHVDLERKYVNCNFEATCGFVWHLWCRTNYLHTNESVAHISSRAVYIYMHAMQISLKVLLRSQRSLKTDCLCCLSGVCSPKASLADYDCEFHLY